MIKDLIKLANYLDSKGLNKEADSIDGIIKKQAFLLPFLMIGCKGNGGLEHNHFVWAHTTEGGKLLFQTLVDENKVDKKYGELEITSGPNQGFISKFAIIKISGLNSEYLTPGISVYQGSTFLTHSYSDMENGNIYDLLEAHENNIDNPNISGVYDGQTYSEDDSQEFTLCFLSTDKFIYERDCLTVEDLINRLSSYAGVDSDDIRIVMSQE